MMSTTLFKDKEVKMKTIIAVTVLAALASASPAFSNETTKIPVASEGQCRKVNDKGCTAWAIRDYRAGTGRAFIVPTSKVAMVKSERCKVARIRIDWEGKFLISTPYGNIDAASKATVVAECQSGSGFGGIGAVSKIGWSGTLIEVERK